MTDGAQTERNAEGASDPTRPCTPAALFEQLWETLADVLGPAATATLLRRSAKYASARLPALAGVAIVREGFEYRYTLPESWQADGPDAMAALRALVDELCQLLVPLTGRVLVRRLENLAEFRRCGVLPLEDRR